MPAKSPKAAGGPSTGKAAARRAAADAAKTRAEAQEMERIEPKKPKRPPFDPTQQPGVIAPVGFFDPLGFSTGIKKKKWFRYRDLELKHGRIAMMACVGSVVQHFVHLDVPRWQTYIKVSPNSLGAIAIYAGPINFFSLGVASLLLFYYLENFWIPSNQGREPGNYGDPFGINMYNLDMRNKELSNARFAMICYSGIFFAELASGKDAVEQLGF